MNMNENDYSITPLSVLSNVSGVNAAKDGEKRKKRRNPKNGSPEEPDSVEIEGQTFHDEAADEPADDQVDGHQIDFCA